jgi:Na+-transporting NADH:ubiquinone oxidoreductase subunit NqrF
MQPGQKSSPIFKLETGDEGVIPGQNGEYFASVSVIGEKGGLARCHCG